MFPKCSGTTGNCNVRYLQSHSVAASLGLALFAWAAILSAPAAAFKCHARTLGETDAAVLEAASSQFRDLGVSGLDYAQDLSGKFQGKLYALRGSRVSMALSAEDRLAKEIRFALSSPSNAADRDAQASMASVFVARYSGIDRRDARTQILDAEAAGEPEFLRFPRDVAVVIFKKDEEDIVLSVGQVHCE